VGTHQETQLDMERLRHALMTPPARYRCRVLAGERQESMSAKRSLGAIEAPRHAALLGQDHFPADRKVAGRSCDFFSSLTSSSPLPSTSNRLNSAFMSSMNSASEIFPFFTQVDEFDACPPPLLVESGERG
jgi:hypothetical protein